MTVAPLDRRGERRQRHTHRSAELWNRSFNAGYRSHVTTATASLPPHLAHAVQDGIGGAMASAPQLGPDAPRVLTAARDAFVSGWALSMWISAGLAVAAAAFAFVWVPRRHVVGNEVVSTELAVVAATVPT